MNAAGWSRAAESIRRGLLFAAAILAASYSLKAAAAAGIIGDNDLAKRLTMVIVGAWFVVTGNALPKTLTPLSVMQCDGARAQALHRFLGWTWVLTGLTFAGVWLALPIDTAESVSMAVIATSIVTVLARLMWLRRTRHKNA